MNTRKKFGDPDYGPYGYGFTNPARADQEPVTNEQYLATVPDDDPWKPVLVEGFKELDREFPGWVIEQIKEKYGECRFYANPSADYNFRYNYPVEFEEILLGIEIACDEATRESIIRWGHK